jgi:hypothetical protein
VPPEICFDEFTETQSAVKVIRNLSTIKSFLSVCGFYRAKCTRARAQQNALKRILSVLIAAMRELVRFAKNRIGICLVYLVTLGVQSNWVHNVLMLIL